ncbi:hypothetical protein PIB30_104854, partial [Stylosanthes scabra]|nr:hypothetical protein [Stylosanthes scabra]
MKAGGVSSLMREIGAQNFCRPYWGGSSLHVFFRQIKLLVAIVRLHCFKLLPLLRCGSSPLSLRLCLSSSNRLYYPWFIPSFFMSLHIFLPPWKQ